MEPATTTGTEWVAAIGNGRVRIGGSFTVHRAPGTVRAIRASASAGIARGSGSAVQITVAQTAASGASIASTALSCMAAKTSVASRQSGPAR